jgi:alcohol dehydrogenase class IV
MRFEFATASRIIFGAGTLSEVAPMAAEMGCRPLVVTGHSGDRAAPLMDALKGQDLEITRCKVSGEPTTDMALDIVQKARRTACDLVIGIGGGSVIDTGKVVAALITNRGPLIDYLEVIGCRAIHCDTDHGRNRIRGNSQRRARFTASPCQSQHAQSIYAAEFGCD